MCCPLINMRTFLLLLIAPLSVLANHLPKAATVPAFQSISGASASYNAGFSPGGQVLYFLSADENVAPGSNRSGALSLFAYTISSEGITNLVRGEEGADINFEQSFEGGVLFSTASSLLLSNDTDNFKDIFILRDGISRISAPQHASASVGDSRNARSSHDGTRVVFESRGQLLEASQGNAFSQIYLWEAGSLVLVSQTDGIPGDDHSRDASISLDGSKVAFVSNAKSLGAGDDRADIFLHVSGTLTNVSAVLAASLGMNKGSSGPKFSKDGSLLFYNSRAKVPGGQETGLLIAYEISTGLYHAVGTNVNTFDATLAGDRVVYASENGVFSWNRNTAQRELLVEAENAGDISVSGDGNLVLFTSTATNLVENGPLDGTHLYLRNISQGSTVWVDRRSGDYAKPAHVFHSVLSADGNLIAFDTDDEGLSEGDLNSKRDVYLSKNGVLQTVSRRDNLLPTATSLGAHYLTKDTLSSSGKYLLLNSSAGDLGPNSNRVASLFLHDRDTKSNLNILAEMGLSLAASNVFEASMSDDARFIFFKNTKERLSYTVDRMDGSVHTKLIRSFSTNGIRQVAFNTEFYPRLATIFDQNPTNVLLEFRLESYSYPDLAEAKISPDGRFFVSRTRQSFYGESVFLRDFNSATSHVVPLSSSWSFSTRVLPFNFSYDSRKLGVIIVNSMSVASGGAFIMDLEATNKTLVASNVMQMRLDEIGNRVVYQVIENQTQQLWWKEMESGEIKRVSRKLGLFGPANGNSTEPGISADGNFVVFSSAASDLLSNDTNGSRDVFLWDARTERTILLSANVAGTASGNAASFNPMFGYDGRTILFESFASDLVENDFNQDKDIFIAHLPTLDSDGDGLYDDWEIAHFGNLSKDGSEDSDQDRLTDNEEFRAGTNPTNGESVFSVIRVLNLSSQTLGMVWSAVPGYRYIVEAKESLDQPWEPISKEITALTSTGRFTQSYSDTQQRYYRVRLVE